MRKEKRHAVDMLLPLSLFLVLAASSLLVVVLSAGIYRHNVEQRDTNYNNRLCLDYVAEKVRKNDKDSEIRTGTFDGLPSLQIVRSYGPGSVYATCLYFDEGEGALYEVFAPADGLESLDRSAGSKILSVPYFSIAQLDGDLFEITCGEEDGRLDSMILSLHTEKGVASE